MRQTKLRQRIATWRRRIPIWVGPAGLTLLLLASIVTAWFLRDLMQGVLDSVARSLWVIALRLRGLPQDEIWGYLVILALFHLIWLLSRGISIPALPPIALRPTGMVQGWVKTLTMNPDPTQLGRIPLGRLQQVTLAVLSQQQRQTLGKLRARLRTGTLDLDEPVQTFLQTGQSQSNELSLAEQQPITQNAGNGGVA
jgi:hypothetical protein